MIQIITSESVNIGHPDKTCDYLADSFLDEALRQDKNAQMAVECAIKDDVLMIYGEATTTAVIDYDNIATKALKDIGYTNKFNIIKKISEQSKDINQAVINTQLNANDQGMVYGYATNETPQLMPLPIVVAHALMKKYESYRSKNNNYYADAKSQVSVAYENGQPIYIDTVLISVSHSSSVNNDIIHNDISDNVIMPVLSQLANFVKPDKLKVIINPSGKFTVWGSFSDSGCVGRKIVVDTYGGVGKVGGGCFSSKNATKVDRSGAYYARYIAKSLVGNNLCDKCEVSLSFAIGQPKPINMYIDCFDTNKVPIETIYDIVNDNFLFTIQDIISELDLLQPIYAKTSVYGHFGNESYPWEKIKTLNMV